MNDWIEEVNDNLYESKKSVRGKMVPGKMVPKKNGPQKNGPRKNFLQKLFSVKRMLGNLNDFHFYQLIPLHTQKNVWRLRHDPTYVPNCRTLNESRKICCRVLGFHGLITSEHSTHPHHDARRPPHDFSFLSFPGTIFPGGHFSGDHFSRGPFFGDHFSGIQEISPQRSSTVTSKVL